ncbi:hypothetical protein B0H15DRAFT_871291 [Mycena belliarum]|uniref:FAD/NAD(P)-binding domain-containing protein n=1 Tax=Mycena belliarum TaxID=1033014 RepID=A0AAD6TR61_9AGAR|nr:hypothetical protein B0H15DRAFT_871291 [Mycena belliae]
MQAISHISQLPGAFPSLDLLSPFREDEALDVAKSIVPAVLDLFSNPSNAAVSSLFHADAFWRDHVALSWSLRTFHPASVISETVVPLILRAAIASSSLVLQEAQVVAFELPNGVSVVRAPFEFRTASPGARCTAAFKLVRMKTGGIKVFTVTTAIQELDAVPWGTVPSADPVDVPSPTIPKSLDVLVVGGGHGGLSISAYLKALRINFAMVEKQPAIGDSWANRYESTTLHTTRIFSGLPFVPFPSDYPQYVPARLIAAYYARYVEELRLPAYPARECISATWDEAAARWTVTLDGVHGTEVLTARQIIFAVGTGGRVPTTPNFPGKDSFLGESLHSSAYTNAGKWAGKRVAIVGAATTACDIAQDCVRDGAAALLVQRGPTRVYPSAHIGALQAAFWNADLPVEAGDVMATEDPIALQAVLSTLVLRRLRDAHDPEYYEGLRRAGFLVNVDGPVHQSLYCDSPHYPDIGAGAAIARGEIKVKSGSEIVSVTPTGLAFSDGTTVDADVIVYATGFLKDSRASIAPIVGAAQAAELEPVWGLDAEGEVRGCWRPSGHDHLWFHCGELQTMRYYGKFLALQVAAELANVRPVPCRR